MSCNKFDYPIYVGKFHKMPTVGHNVWLSIAHEEPLVVIEIEKIEGQKLPKVWVQLPNSFMVFPIHYTIDKETL
jgi:hypothetical protein